MWKIGMLAALVSIFGYTRAVRAQQADASPQREWYGAPILIGGGMAGAALGAEAILAVYGHDVPVALVVPTVAAYLLTGPIVHGVHGEVGRAFGSAGLNIGAPLGGTLLAFMVLMAEPNCDHGMPDEEGPDCTRVPPLIVFEAGFLAGPLIDGLVLARHVHDGPTATRRGTAASVSPMILPIAPDHGRRGLTLGVSGAF